MTRRRRPFKRDLGERRYRKMFVIATEGMKTERQYFAMFSQEALIHIKCLESKKDSAPRKVLRRMEEYLKKEGLREDDEAWLVVDKDQWSDEHLTELSQWAESDERYGLAVSNPKFEYWILLHFEAGNDVAGARQCTERLKGHLPGYKKGNIDQGKLRPGIQKAIIRAKRKDSPPCEDWPRKTGTTVYRLVERLLRSSGT